MILNIIVYFVIYFFIMLLFLVIKRQLAFYTLVKYTGIDEIDMMKKETLYEQARAIQEKLKEKGELLNYKLFRLLQKLFQKNYLSKEQYEKEKNRLESEINHNRNNTIIIPEINLNFLYSLKIVDCGLFLECQKIIKDQKILKQMATNKMFAVFGEENKIEIISL